MSENVQKSFIQKLADGIVRRRVIIVAVFIALMVFSVFSVGWIEMEEDITYYLADSSEAKQGLNIMNEEFTLFATARAMINNVTPQEAEDICGQLEAIPGVYMISFDSSSENSYKDGSALFELTFDDGAESEQCKKAYDDVKACLSNYDSVIQSDSFFDLNATLIKEMSGVLVICVFVVLAVLLFTSSTYAEVLVLIATFIAAAVTNMGTNFLLGRISLISNTVTLVLQLALSVDYAIIFCNRYKEEHELLPVQEAVSSALAKSIPAISASSLTTIAGLAAMTFMQFKLGLDMGIVLIKSIIFSLLTVFLFMPAMLVFCGNLMDRTAHKNFVPKVPFLGRSAYAARFIIPPLFLALVVFGYIGNSRSLYDYSMELMPVAHKNEDDLAREAIESKFGKNNYIAVLVPAGDYETELAFIDELSGCREVNTVLGLASVEAVDGLRLADRVDYKKVMDIADVDETTAKAVIALAAAGQEDYRDAAEDLDGYSVPLIDLFMTLHEFSENGGYELDAEQTAMINELAPEHTSMMNGLDDEQTAMINDLYEELSKAKKQLRSEDHSCIIVYVDLPLQSDETFDFLDRIHSIGNQYYPDGVVLTGDAVSARDFADTFENDIRIVSVLSIVLVMLILLFTFRSIGMPILLIFVIQGSIWMNFAIPAFREEYVFFMCFLIVSAIQMGANIDYAIVISSRYTELRSDGISQKDAMIDALNLAFPTVITSGLMMVAAGLLVGFKVSMSVIAGMGKYVGIGTAISLVLVNFALPAILILGDAFSRATTLKLSDSLLGNFTVPKLRKLAAILLALVSLLTLVFVPVGLGRSQKAIADAATQTSALLGRTVELRDIALSLEENDSAKMDFTEHLLTEEIGAEQLKAGQEEYDAGKDELEKYKAMLAAGESEYRAGVEQYEEGLAEFQAGKEALEIGQAEYAAGVEAYSLGKQQLAEGQAEYDAGVAEVEAAKQVLAEGQAEYDAGLVQLESGKAAYEIASNLFESVRGLYEAGLSAERAYTQAQAELEEMRASGASLIEIRLKEAEVELLRLNYEGAIIGWDDIVATFKQAEADLAAAKEEIDAGQTQLDEGKRQLDEGKVQLAEAEAQLAEAKIQLDDGYAQLAEAETQLLDAKAQIDDGQAQLDEGRRQLEDARAQLDAARDELDNGSGQIKDGEQQLSDADKQIQAGVDTLNLNRQNLQDDLDKLDELSDKREKLKAGMKTLLGVKEISDKAGDSATDAEVCTCAEIYFNEQLNKLQTEGNLMEFVSILLIASALAALIGFLLWLLNKTLLSMISTLIAALGAFSGAVLWKLGCGDFGMLSFWMAALLAVFAAIFADILVRVFKGQINKLYLFH